MSIHTNANGVPGHIHRQSVNPRTRKQKAAEAQAKSLKHRKAKITLDKAPWQKVAAQ
ncbi:hypothetical protein [Roseovarius mucosus]|uniref:hypothetical protein n=1 Tax=Roseovarius mucosus TaxID=215743 RepID=UPI0035D0207D